MKNTIKGVIKPSQLTPFTRHADGLNAFMIVLLYSSALGLLLLSHTMNSITMTALCMLIMGGIQHTLATFIHEAAHGHIFSNKNLNEKLGHFFI